MTMEKISGGAREMITVLRSQGVRGAWRVYRWKLIAAIFFYYLVRDLLVYVILPWSLYFVMSQG